VNVFNLGVDSYVEVNDSIGCISEALGVKPRLEYTGGDRGWIGNNPFIFLDTARIRALGWKPKLNIREGVVKTVEFLKANEWVLEARE
jgi:UDP-glucose 4-epimerase